MVGADLAERVFGSIRVDKETLEKVLKDIEDEFESIDSDDERYCMNAVEPSDETRRLATRIPLRSNDMNSQRVL